MRWRCTGTSTCGTRTSAARDVERDLDRALRRARAASTERWRIPWGHLADFTPNRDGSGAWRSSGGRRTRTTGAGTAPKRCSSGSSSSTVGSCSPTTASASARGGTRRTRPRALVPLLVERARAAASSPARCGRLAGADPGRESRVPSRGSAGRVTALAVETSSTRSRPTPRSWTRSPPSPTPRSRRSRGGALTPPPTRAEEWAAGARGGQGGRRGRADLRGPPQRATSGSRSTGSTPRTTCWASGARTRRRARASRRAIDGDALHGRRCSAPAPAASTARS